MCQKKFGRSGSVVFDWMPVLDAIFSTKKLIRFVYFILLQILLRDISTVPIFVTYYLHVT